MGAVGAIGSIRRGIQSVLDAKHTEFVFYVCMYMWLYSLLAVYTTDSKCTKHPDFQAHDEYLGNHYYIQGTTIKWSDMMTGITHGEDLIMISHHPYQKFPKLSCTLISRFKLSFDTAASLIPTIKCNCMWNVDVSTLTDVKWTAFLAEIACGQPHSQVCHTYELNIHFTITF